jgi:hypothetical protein
MRVEEEEEQEDEGAGLCHAGCVTVMTADRSEGGTRAGCDSELGSGVVVGSAG